jgi:hypothetical protein
MSRSPRTAGSPVSCRRASWSGSSTSMMPTGTWSRGAGRMTIAWVSQAFAQFLDGRAWTHAEGPVTLFEQATGRRRGNIRRLRGAAAAIFGLSLPSPGRRRGPLLRCRRRHC